MTDDAAIGEFSSRGGNQLLNWAFWFRETLTRSAVSFEADPSDENRLEELVHLVAQLIELAATLPLPDEAMDPWDLVPLQRLLEGLTLIREGVPDELLNPRRSPTLLRTREDGLLERKPGRRHSDIRQQRVRGYGVAFVNLFVAAGVAEPQAEAIVANAFTLAGLSGHRKPAITKQTVHYWRAAASAGGKRENEGVLAGAYELLLRQEVGVRLTKSAVEERLQTHAQRLANR